MNIKYTKENLEEIIKRSITWNEVCIALGIKSRTGAQTHLKKRATDLGLDFSHFVGQAWAKGRPSSNKKDALELCKLDSRVPSHRLKLKLIKDGYKEEKCECCGIKEWMGEPVVLELDHVNSNHMDNRIENLRILCPNCHALKTRNASVKETGKPITLRT